MPTRRPGRPPLDRDDPSVGLNVKIPSKLFDAACDLAARQRISLPEAVRRAIRRAARASDNGDDED